MQPQPWDNAKVAQAVADARELVEALGQEADQVDRYKERVGDLMTARLDDATDMQDFASRLAYVLYGFALYGLGATAMASGANEELSTTIDRIVASLDVWLNANP